MDHRRSSARLADRGRPRRAPHHALSTRATAWVARAAHDRLPRRPPLAGRRGARRAAAARHRRAPPPAGARVSLITDRLEEGRERTLALLAPFDDDYLTAQHSPIMSPLVWDLAHIGNY